VSNVGFGLVGFFLGGLVGVFGGFWGGLLDWGAFGAGLSV
jgi:hypothetical protein